MHVVLRIKEQAGHQGGPLLTQPTLSHFFSMGPPDLTVPSSFVSDQRDHATCSRVRKVRGCRSQAQPWPRYYWWQVQSRKGT